MRDPSRLVLIGVLSVCGAGLATTQVQAQVAPHGADPHRYQVERHQARMEALRDQADIRALDAARLQTETRLTLMELEARRQPQTPYVDRAAPPSDPAQTTERHRRTRETVTQIDDWLERRPDRTDQVGGGGPNFPD